MLFQRILAAAFMIGFLTAAMCADYYYFANSFLLHAFCLIGTFFCLREFWTLCRAREMQTFSTWGTLSGVALVVAHFWALQIWCTPGEDLFERVAYLNRADRVITGAMAVAVMGVFFLTARRHQYEASLGGLGVTCLGLIYLWFLPSFLLKLRHLGDDGMLGGRNWNTFGSKMVVATIVISKGCDVFAYLLGRKFGKHKAFPDLSPGKTKEGVAAGLIGSVLLALLLRMPFFDVLPESQFGVMKAIIFGFCIGISGIMGDLSESLLKRSAGVKDASHVVPGYGGVLDVIDSLVIAGPVAYFLVPLMIYWG